LHDDEDDETDEPQIGEDEQGVGEEPVVKEEPVEH
jgi:hypothetical protein